MTINDSGKFIPSTEPSASRSGFRLSPGSSSVTKSAEPAAHLTAIAGEPRSHDGGRRPPPDRLAATPGLVGRGLLGRDTNHPAGKLIGRLLHLSPGEAMTVGDPPTSHAARWAAPRSIQPSSWGLESGGFFNPTRVELANDPSDPPTSW